MKSVQCQGNLIYTARTKRVFCLCYNSYQSDVNGYGCKMIEENAENNLLHVLHHTFMFVADKKSPKCWYNLKLYVMWLNL
jgi:hypothetical protein